MKGQKRDLDDDCDRILNQYYPRHPGKGHTLGECTVLAKALKSGAYKKQCSTDKGKGKPHDHDDMEEDDARDKDPRHGFREPTKNVTAIIFGCRVGLENKRDKKVLQWTIMAIS